VRGKNILIGAVNMAIFRVEKTRDYTVMSNHHLKNIRISLRAKGLLSIMLSLPENWDYTLKGLARISLKEWMPFERQFRSWRWRGTLCAPE